MGKAKNVNRRGAYAFYRSLRDPETGKHLYTAKQAANMRNRAPVRIIEEYRRVRAVYNEKRIEEYKGGEKRKMPPPERPHLEFSEDINEHYRSRMQGRDIPEHIIDQMFQQSDAFDIDIYDRRMEGFIEFFTEHDKDWEQLMDEYGDIEDLGEWLDFLGELYDELKG